MPLAGHLHLAPLGEEVDHGHTHAMETARRLIGPLFKLPAKLEHRHHALERGDLPFHLLGKLRMAVDRDAAAVVLNRHTPVDIHRHAHMLGVAGHALVDRVVDHLVDEMVEPAGGVIADVHAKPLADMLAVGEVL